MAIDTRISLKTVIGKIYRDLGPGKTENDVDSIIEWCLETYFKIASPDSLIYVKEDLYVENHKIEFPCGLYKMLALEYKGCRIKSHSGRMTPKWLNSSTPTTGLNYLPILKKEITINEEGEVTKEIVNLDPANSSISYIPQMESTSHYYHKQGEHLVTSIESEEIVTLHYLAFDLDEEGLPYIPNSEYLKEAMYWRVLFKMMMRGYKNPNVRLDYVDSKYKENIRKASNAIRFPDSDRLDELNRLLVRNLPTKQYWNSFNNSSTA